MAPIITALLTASALVLFCVVLVLAAEIVAGVLSSSPNRPSIKSAPTTSYSPIAVIVPAHNESAGMLPTLADIRAQLSSSDRLIVVADNCSDDTAAVAASTGAEVVSRYDPSKIGKGYALARGLEHLRSSPPTIVIMIDADCRVGEEAIDRLAETCSATGRPTQALYLMRAAKDSPASMQVAEFAWLVKNWVRPLGLRALGLPCQLTGSGMAFPWDVIRSVDLASGEIVEDLKLGLDLARAGAAPLFCPAAIVTSQFPTSIVGVKTQRMRWEQGHLGMLLRYVPKLVFAGVTEANLKLWCLALDLAIPPLSLLTVLIFVMIVVSFLVALFGLSSLPLVLAISSLLLFAMSLVASWHSYGRQVLGYNELLQLPTYLFKKIPMYTQIILRRSPLRWDRTDRTGN